MLQKKEIDLIMDCLEKRKTSLKKLDNIPIIDNIYLKFISNYKTVEINPDLELFGYEEAIKENAYIYKHYQYLTDTLWLFGQSGQGDHWFVRKEDNRIVFYCHDKGEYAKDGFQAMDINFKALLQMADLCKQLEEDLENLEVLKQSFEEQVHSISKNLLERYPYKYW